jgi:hypothetical protein
MSSFDESIFGNEPALDMGVLWAEVVAPELDALRSTHDSILARLEENGFTAPLYRGDSFRNAQLLALGELFIRNGVTLPERLQRALASAVANELYSEALSEWASPTRRKQALLEYCSRIGIRRPRPRKPTREDLVEYPSSAALDSKLSTWLDDPKQMADSDYPRLCRILDTLIESRLGFDYDDAYTDVTRQRLMTVAFYLCYKLRVEPRIAKDLLTAARSFVWPGIAP